ncbi:MOSC domain-containing protein [Jatrophihabitans telluris]|uniref:MOSC domain-containing protein n=1 Tax=Jatrophihabitans telluris TaxID=2038343 RepID=A0ABY4QTW3_9ACTN|nr:MOSC N-terminal beta barrel domain-containing protein [Jatrophihabitans telluris]UQX86774.1 MOSC domain-containing protein [Jatrophihabitans telluris]
MRVESLQIYPVKSTKGLSVSSAEVQPWGLRHDRRWLVLDPGGENITARTHKKLLSVTALPQPDGSLQLSAPDLPALCVTAPTTGALLDTGLSRIDQLRDAGAEAAAWFGDLLALPARLAWQDDPRRRAVGAHHGGRAEDVMNLADAGPLLLTTGASLSRLNEWVAQTAAELSEPVPSPLVMDRFRPNVVVRDAEVPFGEDRWTRVRIGDVAFRASELCDRCVMTTIEPSSLAKGKEPIRTLARHRRWDGAVWFGLRLIPEATGTIRVEDVVTAE